MILIDQVPSLELSKRLKELGVKQESYFSWYQEDINGWSILRSGLPTSGEVYAAFTVAELGHLASRWFRGNDFLTTRMEGGEWDIEIQEMRDGELKPVVFSSATEADARAKMLIYLIEYKLIELP